MHVIGNMWFLYIFGDNVEDYLGHFKYLVFYLLTGLIAMLTQVAMNLHSTVPTVGSERSDCGSAGSVFYFVSAGAGADMVFCVCDMGAGVDYPGILVCAEFSERDGERAGGAGAEHGGRGVLGARGGICFGSAAGENFWGAGVAVSVCGGVILKVSHRQDQRLEHRGTRGFTG